MKRIAGVTLALAAFCACALMLWGYSVQDRHTEAYRPGNLIRLRVVAASDSIEDQETKLRVRDAALDHLSEGLKVAEGLPQARSLIEEKIAAIEQIANRVLEEEGLSYTASARLCQGFAPARTYGEVYVPPGWYDTLEVVLGEGGGENWWCVVFPPFCFVDCTEPTAGRVALASKPSDEVQVRFWIVEALHRAKKTLGYLVVQGPGR